MYDTEPMLAIFNALICAGADINARDRIDQTPLHKAMLRPVPQYGDAVQALWELIDAGAYVNARDHIGQTPLHFAARGGYIAWNRDRGVKDAVQLRRTFEIQSEFIEILTAAGVDVDAKDRNGNTPADIAIANGHPDLADVLQ